MTNLCYNSGKQNGEEFPMQHKSISTKKLVFSALMAALTVAGSALRIKVPDVFGFSAFHLGNIICALSGILLGPWLGGVAAGLGSAIFDMLDPMYISECWLTFLMKGAYGVVAGLIAGNYKGTYLRGVIASVCGALTYAALYLLKVYAYSGRLLSGLTHDAAILKVLTKIPATTFNAAVAIIAAPLLAMAIYKALEKSHLSLQS